MDGACGLSPGISSSLWNRYLTVMVTLSLTCGKDERELGRALLSVLGANFALSLPVFVPVLWQDYLDLLLEVNTDEIPQIMRTVGGEW